jgi:hypothetical protein
MGRVVPIVRVSTSASASCVLLSFDFVVLHVLEATSDGKSSSALYTTVSSHNHQRDGTEGLGIRTIARPVASLDLDLERDRWRLLS